MKQWVDDLAGMRASALRAPREAPTKLPGNVVIGIWERQGCRCFDCGGAMAWDSGLVVLRGARRLVCRRCAAEEEE